MSSETFTPAQNRLVLQYLDQVESSRHAMVWGQFIVDLSRVFSLNPCGALEALLRERNSNTYLLGLVLKDPYNFEVKLPHTQEKYPYQLWTEVNGPKAASQIREEEEITPEINLARLPRTGLLVAKPDSQLSRQIHAKFN